MFFSQHFYFPLSSKIKILTDAELSFDGTVAVLLSTNPNKKDQPKPILINHDNKVLFIIVFFD